MEDFQESRLRRREPARIDVPEGRIRVLESHHALDFEMAMSEWPFAKICWVAMGRGRLESAEEGTGIQRNDFLLLPANWRHRFVDEPGAPMTLVILCVSARWLAGEGEPLRAPHWQRVLAPASAGRPISARTAFLHNQAVGLFRRALQEQSRGRPGWELALSALTDQLLLLLARDAFEPRIDHQQSSRQAVAGAIEYIDSHLFESMQIAEVAGLCGLSPRRFTGLFKELTGETFSQYLNRRRVEHAQERLAQTGQILYACHESGFNDTAYFYRVFKKHTGLTPGEYLKRFGQDP